MFDEHAVIGYQQNNTTQDHITSKMQNSDDGFMCGRSVEERRSQVFVKENKNEKKEYYSLPF